MTAGDGIVLAVLGLVIGAILRKLHRDRKNGRCCGNCAGCTGCNHAKE